MVTTAEQARAFIAGAGVLVTVNNTYHQRWTGVRLQIEKVGKSFFDARMLDGPNPGADFRGHIPTRDRDVVSIDGDTATFNLDNGRTSVPRLAGHTVTYRKAPR